MEKMRIIGLMSGTSLDGLDVVDVTVWEQAKSIQFKINNAASIPYSKEEQNSLKSCFNASKKEVEKASLNYGSYLGNAVNNFARDFQITDIDFIASHGHTVFHKPEEGITVQIGDGQVLSNTTGLEVICDFRVQDVELGGQGAPLVPIGDQFLFSNYKYCLNLGGFANVSFDERGVRKAYDICPVNIVLNHYTRKIGFEYDDQGTIAKSGEINQALFQALNNVPFYSKPYPKALGYEFVVEEILPLIDRFELEIPDVLRTFIEHVATQLNANLQIENSAVLITGGGAYNSFLLERLDFLSKLKLVIPEKTLVEFKEALIFGLLGYLKKHDRINCLSSVTGAVRDHSSGKIYKPKK